MISFKGKYFEYRIHRVISILRILFGILFIFSAATKFYDIAAFESSIKKFALVPDYFAGAISYFVPLVEFILGSFLIFKIKLELTLQLIIYLLVFFTSVISVTLVEGGDISCGCFGSLSSSNIDLTTVFRNIFLLIWGLLLLIYTFKNKYSASANHKIKNKIKIFFVVNLLFFLIVQNSAFAIRNIELKNRVYWLMDNDILSEGERINALKVFNLNGKEENILFQESSYTILFIMQYGCHLCKENAIFWNQLVEMIDKSNDVRFYGISIDPLNITQKIILEYHPKFNVVFNSNADFRNDLKLFKTPMTFVINNKGSVKSIYKGKLNEVLIERIAQELNNK